MKKQEMSAFFPYGVSYYRPATPLRKHWEKDLKSIAEAGFNTIRVSAFWSRIEKTEGVYDFSEFDDICDAAASHGLKVLMTLYIVNMPEWLFTKYPEARMVSAGGRVQYSEHHPDAVAGGWPGLCMDCDEVKESMLAFVREITLHYKGNDTLLAFDVIHEPWEEPSQEYYIDSWKNMVYCYCDHSIEKFRKWLGMKYGSLEVLNQAWSRSYSDWTQVQPPRNFAAYADWLDWRNFSIEALTDESMAAGMTVKRYDPDRVTVNHSGGVLNAFATSNDAFALAKTVDIPGMSNYAIRSPESAGMCCDFLRSASPDNGNFWIGETSGGSGPMFSFIGEDIESFFAFGMPWSKAVQRKHIWKMLAHGAKGLINWMWRPELFGCETAAMGFTDREGNVTERVENACEIAAVIQGHEKFFLRGKTQTAEVAVLYNRNTSVLEGLCATAKARGGAAGLFANYKDLASIGGVAKICMDNSVPTDYFDSDMLKEGIPKKYKLLIMPYSICISAGEARKIAEYVNNGGTVVADALCGYFTEEGWGAEVVPANGLDQVFGAKVLEYKYSLDISFTYEEALHIKSAFVQEKLALLGGKVIGSFADGSPAAVYNDYGKGRAIYFAAPVFMHAKKNDFATMAALTRRLSELAGLDRQIEVEGDQIEVRILECDSDRFTILLNHEDAPAAATVRLPFTQALSSITDAESKHKITSYTQAEGSLTISVQLPPLGTRLIVIEA